MQMRNISILLLCGIPIYLCIVSKKLVMQRLRVNMLFGERIRRFYKEEQQKMSLGLVDYYDGSYDEINSLETVMQKGGFDKNSRHQWDVVKEAYACCIELSRKLFQFPAGLQWYSGSGYTSAWRVFHHAEEVMIEVTDDSTVVREAKNDFRSLQGSKVSGKIGRASCRE